MNIIRHETATAASNGIHFHVPIINQHSSMSSAKMGLSRSLRVKIVIILPPVDNNFHNTPGGFLQNRTRS